MTELEAELYALTHRGHPGDAEFYARACAGARNVLELGTGYGRLLPALLAVAGHVMGLDRERRLLAAARRSLRSKSAARRGSLTLVHGDMESFALGVAFDRIVVPYNTLYCLRSRRALLRCFRSVRSHLAAGGTFSFDVWTADGFQRRAQCRAHRDERGAIVSLVHRAQTWDVFEKSRLASAQQRLCVDYTYVSRERGTRVHHRIEQRYAPSRELFEILQAAGLRVDRCWGDFRGGRFELRSPHLIVQASALASKG